METITVKSIYDCNIDKQLIKELRAYVQPKRYMCHMNASKSMWFANDHNIDFTYCEGRLYGWLNHCFIKYNNEYFDLTQKKGDSAEAELVYEANYEEWNKEMSKHIGEWTFYKL